MITLYDFDSNLDGKSWNPHVWKTRFSLHYKGLSYETIWIEYPDVEDLCKRIDAAPTDKKPSGEPHYTLPVILDNTTGMAISDSFRIAEYLDRTYPELPTLIPQGTRALHFALSEAFSTRILVYRPFLLSASVAFLNERSLEYMRRTREPRFGKRLEDLVADPGTEERDAAWRKWKEALALVDAWLNQDDVWIMGDVGPSFADFTIAPHVLSAKRFFGKDSREWKDVSQWHDGRWARLAKNMERYM